MVESSRTHVRIAVIENCSHDLELPASFWMLRSKYNISCAANTTRKATWRVEAGLLVEVFFVQMLHAGRCAHGALCPPPYSAHCGT